MVVLGVAETTGPKPVLKVVEGLHTYEVAPVAVSVTGLPPTQVVPVLGETVMLKGAAMVTLMVFVPVQPAVVVPTTVYGVLTVGDATTTEPVEPLRPPVGDHE